MLHLEQRTAPLPGYSAVTLVERRLQISDLAKVADLEAVLQERGRTIARERRGTLLEAQHLEESFSSKCFPWVLPAGTPASCPW